MFVEMEYLGRIYIFSAICQLGALSPTSTKSQPFVLMFSIVSVEVCQLIFLGILVLFNLVIFCLEIVLDFDGFVQY